MRKVTRSADMVLYYRSTALGEDKPVVIYAGKDKVCPATLRRPQSRRPLTEKLILIASSKVRRSPWRGETGYS